MQMQQGGSDKGKKENEEAEKSEGEMNEEEKAEMKRAKEMQETLEKSLASIQEKLDDPKTSASQREKLEQMKQNMERLSQQTCDRHTAAEEWERIVESDKAKALLKTLAAGGSLPDDQWNKLLSTLDDGLWQVRGKTPSEDYRKAIEQYQERLRQLMNTTGSGAE